MVSLIPISENGCGGIARTVATFLVEVYLDDLLEVGAHYSQ